MKVLLVGLLYMLVVFSDTPKLLTVAKLLADSYMSGVALEPPLLRVKPFMVEIAPETEPVTIGPNRR